MAFKLTAEQEEHIRREFKESPTSHLVTLPPEQDAALARAIELEEAANEIDRLARALRLHLVPISA